MSTSPRTIGRVIAVLFIVTLVAGVFAQVFVSERLIDFSDATATANNILANRDLFQAGFTVYLIEMASQLATVALWYVLLKRVNRSIALVYLILEVAGCIVKIFARVLFIATPWVLASP